MMMMMIMIMLKVLMLYTAHLDDFWRKAEKALTWSSAT